MADDLNKRTTVAKTKTPITSKTILAGAFVVASGIAEIIGYVQEEGIPQDKMGWIHVAAGAAVIAFRWMAKQPVSAKNDSQTVEAP